MPLANETPKGIRRILVRVALLAIVIGIGALIWAFNRPDQPVRTTYAKRQDMTTTVTTNGKIEPIQNFEAHSPSALIVRRILVQSGQQVKAGQLLMQLDDVDARAQAAKATADLRAAEAESNSVQHGGSQEEVLSVDADLAKGQSELAAARNNLKTLEQLQSAGAATTSEIQNARNRLNAAQQQIDYLEKRKTGRYSSQDISKAAAREEQARTAYSAAEQLVHQTNITAPFAGTVYALPVRESEFVNAGEMLLQLADLTNVQVRAFVDEPEIGHIGIGQPVSVEWDALPGQNWSGRVTEVPSTIINYGTRNVGEVLCRIDNRESRLLPNINVTVSIVTSNQNNVITLPREAIHADDSRRFVYVVADGRLRRAYIDQGASNLTLVELKSGIPEGTEVALGTLNGQPLSDGMAVRAVQR